MTFRTDPLLLAVALGLLSPAAFQVEGDLLGEDNPPPMISSVHDNKTVDTDDTTAAVPAPARDERIG